MLETVAHAESRMRALMAQLQEKKSIDPRKRVDLGALLERIRLAKRHQRPALEIKAEGAITFEVEAHPERLERVIGHIVQNALDATLEDGKVSVQMDTGNDGKSARIVIQDTGCGMSAEFMRESLFKPFNTSKASGMGIGVYETQQYVQELGGTLRFDSEPGRGTRVAVTLPGHARAESRESELVERVSDDYE
jgi:hypothetical protein